MLNVLPLAILNFTISNKLGKFLEGNDIKKNNGELKSK